MEENKTYLIQLNFNRFKLMYRHFDRRWIVECQSLKHHWWGQEIVFQSKNVWNWVVCFKGCHFVLLFNFFINIL